MAHVVLWLSAVFVVLTTELYVSPHHSWSPRSCVCSECFKYGPCYHPTPPLLTQHINSQHHQIIFCGPTTLWMYTDPVVSGRWSYMTPTYISSPTWLHTPQLRLKPLPQRLWSYDHMALYKCLYYYYYYYGLVKWFSTQLTSASTMDHLIVFTRWCQIWCIELTWVTTPNCISVGFFLISPIKSQRFSISWPVTPKFPLLLLPINIFLWPTCVTSLNGI